MADFQRQGATSSAVAGGDLPPDLELARASDRMHRAMVAALDAIAWIADDRGGFLERQPAWEAYTGLEWPRYGGAGWLAAVHPDEREAVEAVWRRAVAAPAVTDLETRLWHQASGQHRRCHIRAVPLTDADGRAQRWIGTMTDIEARRRADERLRFLAEISAQFGRAVGEPVLRDIAQLAVPILADWCLLDIRDDGGAVSRVCAAAPDGGGDVATRLARVAAAPGSLRWQAFHDGRRHFVPEAGAAERIALAGDAGTDLAAELGTGSFIIVPLAARGRILGALTLAFGASQRRYEEDDVAFVGLIAVRVALALDNARLLEGERRARRAAEVSSHRLEQLHRVAASLAEAESVDDVARLIAQAGIEALGCDRAALAVPSQPGRLALIGAIGLAPDAERAYAGFPVEAPIPLARAFAGAAPIFLESAEAIAALGTDLGPIVTGAASAAAFVPLLAGDRVVGSFGFGFAAPHRFDADERAFLITLGKQSALVLEKARLFEAEKVALYQAEQARAETEVMFRLAAHANRARTVEDVYQPALDALTQLLGVDRAAILLFDPDGVMRFKAWRGLTDRYRQAVEGHSPWSRDTVDAAPLVVENAAADASLAAYRGLFADEQIAALGFIPLAHQGALLGKLMIYDRRPRAFRRRELQLAEVVASQIAQAVARGQLLASERRARDNAERSAERTRHLQRVTARMSKALLGPEIAEVVIDEGTRALGAFAGALWRLAADGSCLELIRARNFPELERFQTIPLVAEIPLGDAVRRGEPVWLETRAEYAARYPVSEARVRGLNDDANLAIACVPLRLDGRTLGAVFFSFNDARCFDDEERAFITLIAQHCAQGLERARLYEAERRARRDAEAAHERAAFLAEASALLAGSLHHETTLRNVAALAVPRIADLCWIDMAGADGVPVQVAVAHVDPARVAEVTELRRRFPSDPAAARGTAAVIRTGQSELYEDISDELLTASASNPERAAALRGLGLRSAMAVPISAHGRTLGAIGFLSSSSGRRFGRNDLVMAEQLGERAGLAVVNARLYQLERMARAQAANLQRATATFGAASSVDEVAELAVRLGKDLLGAAGGLVYLVRDDRAALTVIGHPADAADRALAMSAATPAAAAAHSGEAVFVETAADLAAYPDLEATPSACAAIPFRLHGQVLGVLALRFPTWRVFPDEDRGFLQAVGEQCAQALDRARSYDHAVKAVALRDEFLSIAGHELRTPLTALMFQAEWLVRLSNDGDLSRIKGSADKLVRQAERLDKLIEELLDVSRITAGRLVLELADVDLSAVVHDIAHRLGDDLARAGSQLQLSADSAVVARCDRTRIEQVVTNLMSNAIKYGKGQPIDVELATHADRVVLSVRDRGIGIAPEDQARIFDRFERAVSSRHFGGLGLGLWIVHQIIEAHGGAIAVQSEPGQGATFIAELPVTGPTRVRAASEGAP